MNGYDFNFAGHGLTALPSGALFWAARGLLCVSDLHLGKSERLARRGGGLLPPYDSLATLSRLSDDLDRTGAGRVICLGDSFDDLAAGAALGEAERQTLMRLMAGREWVWVEGNHDPGPLDIGGSHRAELWIEQLVFRHQAESRSAAEISGHYHPKQRLAGTARPCFLLDEKRVILPAYGTYTGGLFCDAPELDRLMGPGALAILTGSRALPCPMRPRRA
ncbi:ligase-associated DNA damage response endonuclease PdeM [Neogemmobacter tilapiae]|uniref:Metallophosphoesterase n=1 Tax=Neogemmobacter tilapiae TaxID=875041 RepID=A0A918WJ91_9RHOB|nr:ligase-associated DNA damage response endonuclease PdeM [Gemmobacter tilapiae]GHC56833.1 metallophosphoesterase [Gemmobacter tilapiae]